MSLEDDIVPVVADIEGAILDLAAKIRAFSSETFDQLPDVPKAQAFLVTWNAFVLDFERWRGALWFDRWGRRNEVLAYRKRFNGLQEFWRGLVGTVATTTPAFKAAEVTGPTYGIPSWAVPAALAIGALVLVSQLSGVLGPALGSLKGMVASRANPRRRRR